jgi:hypothetical protein
MHDVIALWHADHINFAKLLNLLEDQLEVVHAGGGNGDPPACSRAAS